MMAIAAEGVRPDKIEDDPDRTGNLFFSYPVNRTSRNGATGTPTTASAEAGETLFKWAVDDLASQVELALTEEPPFEPGPAHQ